jgi:PhnB protein
MIEVTPFLAVRDAERAVEFYAAAFGAEELARVTAPSGAIVAELAIGEARFSLATEAPELGTPSPETAGVTTVRLSLHVDDPDAAQRSAIEAGAVEMFPVADQPYGWRQGRIVDPFGHHWLVGRRL